MASRYVELTTEEQVIEAIDVAQVRTSRRGPWTSAALSFENGLDDWKKRHPDWFSRDVADGWKYAVLVEDDD